MSAEAKIREALEAGPTPGPWTASNRGSYGIGVGDEGSVYGPDGEDTGAEFVKPIGDQPTIRGELWYRDAAYVAACNPTAMTELLAELDRLRAEVEGLRADAERYRWLREQRGLSLETVAPSTWTREDGSTFVPTHRLCAGGTGFSAYPTMDETIDAARALSGPKGQGSV